MKWHAGPDAVRAQRVDRPRSGRGHATKGRRQDLDARKRVVHVSDTGCRRAQLDHEQVPRVLVARANRWQDQHAVPLQVREGLAIPGGDHGARRLEGRGARELAQPSDAATSVRFSSSAASIS